MKERVIILLGPPGSGKGTQGLKLAKELHIPEISTGDILRRAIKYKSSLGKKAEQYVTSGKLVPDDIMMGLIDERIGEKDCSDGFILDGFPRTIAQAEGLEKVLEGKDLKVDLVINFTINLSSLIKRLVNRRICSGCGKIYNLKTMPPKKDRICDVCGSELYHREDDKEETIRERFNVYKRQTEPLIKFYSSKDLIKEVSADGDIDSIFQKILEIVKK